MNGTSKYLQVTEWIQKRIASGELVGGDKLESENEISSLFGISRQTVRHALGLLVQQGILTTVRGSGTYIADAYMRGEVEKTLSRTVTIISTYADGYIFPRILRAMVKKLEEHAYSARIMFTNNQISTERSLLRRLLEEGKRDPLIVEPVMSGLPNPNRKYYLRMKERGIPILFFHSFYPELDIPHVCMNDEEAGRLATEYLIQQGHKNIGGIFKADDGQGRRRYMGYLKALIKAGIEVREERICWVDTLELRAFPVMKPKILERLKGCTACVCYNDEVAHELTEFAAQEKILIPDQLSVVSIDNSELARLNGVPLTSVSHPMEILGEKAAENILRLIEDPGFDATWEFPVELEIRSSVRSLK